MATEETVQLNELHAPQQASIDAFNSILPDLKGQLAKLRRDHDSGCTILATQAQLITARTRAGVLPRRQGSFRRRSDFLLLL
jgi:hypothetical protein